MGTALSNSRRSYNAAQLGGATTEPVAESGLEIPTPEGLAPDVVSGRGWLGGGDPIGVVRVVAAGPGPGGVLIRTVSRITVGLPGAGTGPRH